MKKTLSLTVILLATTMLMAHPVEPARVQQAAQTFWSQTLQARGTLMPVEWQYHNLLLFSTQQGGFVVMAANDCARPVIGYATQGMMLVDRIPDALKERLDKMELQIEVAQETDAVATANDAQMWNTLLAGGAVKGDDDDAVEPLLSTTWDQDPYYNKYCPTNTVSGCVATAEAQLMKYYNHPAFGRGSHSYKHQKHGTLSADFAHTLYQWDKMPNRLTAASSTEQVDAVATLIYHIGVAVHMDYNSATEGGSGAIGLAGMAGIASEDNSLKDYFYYNPDMQVINKDYGYSDNTWANALIEELKKQQPILYGGVSSAGGHAFVCDGYKMTSTQPYFHFNFGWDGVADGYFTADNICPNVSPTGQTGQTYYFTQNNSALLGCTPVYALRASDTVFSLNAADTTVSFLVTNNPMMDAIMQMEVDQDWFSVDDSEGPVHVHIEANDGSTMRVGNITFTQGPEKVVVKILQMPANTDDFCPVRVHMTASHGTGWRNGANLTLESAEGYVYGTASLANGSEGDTTIYVGQHDLMVRWHTGGGTDREIGYTVYNAYDEALVDVEYAYHNGKDMLVSWPCVKVGIDEAEGNTLTLAPNPVADQLTISGLPTGETATLYDLLGRKLLTLEVGSTTLDMSRLQAGVYMLRACGQAYKVVKR